ACLGQAAQLAVQLGVAGVAAQAALNVLGDIAEQGALLAQFELTQAQVGNLIGEIALEVQARQFELLLVENLRQQQTATQHVDLLLQGLLGLAEVVQLLAYLQVLRGQAVEPVGSLEQLLGIFLVEQAFFLQQAVAAIVLGLAAQLGDGLLGLRATLVADQFLEGENVAFQATDAQVEQVAAAAGQLQQLVVAGKTLTQQQVVAVQRRQFGLQQVALFTAQRAITVAVALQLVADLLAACLVVADLRLGALWPGLCGDQLTVTFTQCLLPLAQLLVEFP